MKILVIGGTNFIGPAVSEQLVQSGHKVTLFHRSLSLTSQHKQIQGDCNRVGDLSRALEAIEPDVIIHMIALFESHIKVLEQTLQGEKTRVVIISSVDVYKAYEVFFGLSNSPVVPMPLNEHAQLRDVLYPYRGKLEADFAHDYEKILVEKAVLQSSVIDAIVLRLGMVYGRNDPNHRFLEPIQKMRQGVKKIELPEGLADFRASKCYAKNIAYGVKLVVESDIKNEIYNLAEQQSLTEWEWHQQIAKLIDWRGDIVTIKTPELGEMPNLMQHLLMDTGKIRKQLRYKELFSIDDGLSDTIRWELANIIK